MGNNTTRCVLLGMLALMLAACAHQSPDNIAREHGFRASLVKGQDFSHREYFREGTGDILHVYIEGDGRPFVSRTLVARDPTPFNTPMLELMAMDSAPSLYVGRPCYFQTQDPACSPLLWTHRRYAPEVVRSMNAVIDQHTESYRQVALFGHSGGGTLAMLLARRRQDVAAVVTLAGNLDIDAWTRYHDYTPLEGSTNPATQPALAASVTQLHLVGEEDKNIRPDMLQPTVERQPNAELRVIDSVDHSCCWVRYWPALLAELSELPAEVQP